MAKCVMNVTGSFNNEDSVMNDMSEENMMQAIPKMKTNNNFNVLLNNQMGNLKISENP